jgi:hypothetical protein
MVGTLRKESRNWQDYAQRIVWYTFGTPGDIDIAAFKPTPRENSEFSSGSRTTGGGAALSNGAGSAKNDAYAVKAIVIQKSFCLFTLYAIPLLR